MAEIQQAAIAAANWWTNQLAKPTLNSFKICNNSTSGYLMTLASLSNAKSHLATKELLKDFCDELSKQIDLELSRTSAFYLSCDTSPCYILLGVADLVGVKNCLFPYHRNMWITPTSVRVQDGYGADILGIFHI